MEMERGRRVFGVLVTLRVSCAGLCARDACAERGTRAGDASRLGALSSHAAAPPRRSSLDVRQQGRAERVKLCSHLYYRNAVRVSENAKNFLGGALVFSCMHVGRCSSPVYSAYGKIRECFAKILQDSRPFCEGLKDVDISHRNTTTTQTRGTALRLNGQYSHAFSSCGFVASPLGAKGNRSVSAPAAPRPEPAAPRPEPPNQSGNAC